MSPHLPEPKQILLVAGGAVLGALSWLAASALSGAFEPYDSSVGLLVNQAIVTVPTVYLALRHKPTTPALLLLGAYLGMNSYSYIFGSSESRVWAALGAMTSLLLVVGPAAFASGVLLLRYFRRSRRA